MYRKEGHADLHSVKFVLQMQILLQYYTVRPAAICFSNRLHIALAIGVIFHYWRLHKDDPTVFQTLKRLLGVVCNAPIVNVVVYF